MNPSPMAQTETSLVEMLGTFLQVSAPYAPENITLRDAAARFYAWARRQPVVRLNRVYDHLATGTLDPQWEELEWEGVH